MESVAVVVDVGKVKKHSNLTMCHFKCAEVIGHSGWRRSVSPLPLDYSTD